MTAIVKRATASVRCRKRLKEVAVTKVSKSLKPSKTLEPGKQIRSAAKSSNDQQLDHRKVTE